MASVSQVHAVGVAPAANGGSWVVSSDGSVRDVNGAPDLGILAATPNQRSIAGIASTPDRRGYWLVGTGGEVYTFGDAKFYGSVSKLAKERSVVGIAAAGSGHGYWVADSEGRVFDFGSATPLGRESTKPMGQIVGIASTKSGTGFWLVGVKGSVYSFGSARFFGSAFKEHRLASIVGIASTPDSAGYWVVTSDGAVITFGDARLGHPVTNPTGPMVTGVAPTATNDLSVLADSGAVTLYSNASPPWTPPADPPVPVPTLPGGPMHLTWNDEFDGTSLSNTWNTCWWYSPSPDGCSNGTAEAEWYTPQNVSVGNGMLSLTAHDTPVQGVDMATRQPRTYDYTSGMVDTRGAFSFTYGYVEWRADVPAGQGLWPALWMMPANDQWPPEIDALETVGRQPDLANFTYHPPSPTPSQGYDSVIPNLSGQWHTFGVDWEPGSITWYVDGKAYATCTDQVTSGAMYLVMDLALGGTWAGMPDSTTQFPSSLDVDYVRVWQH